MSKTSVFVFSIMYLHHMCPVVCVCGQVDMYAGALFIQLALQWNIYVAVVLLLSVTALYTVAGDLSPFLAILKTPCLEIVRA